MESLLLLSLSILWGVVSVILALTLRILRWLRASSEARMKQQETMEERPALIIGAPAGDFKARTLAGKAVRLDDYAGRSVIFIFVSPTCGHCRMEMPTLIKLAPLAQKNAGTEIILVSDWGPVVTQQWLGTIRSEDHVDVQLPILVAPRGKTDFLDDYNPRHLTPSFCLLDAQGNVQATGGIPSTAWNKLKRIWEGATKLPAFTFMKPDDVGQKGHEV
ncbi:MAG TPA: TlpA disulfide reductase family protein [Ktedonobacteraceae bacterium]|nr:TlpA disulfide reductase family protein [Ktedonobacteraceae bacterium]